MIKGQNFRVFLNDKCVAASQSCTIEISSDVEESSTKDSTGGAHENEVTGYGYTVSANGLLNVDADATGNTSIDILKLQLAGKAVEWKATLTGGAKNRVAQTGATVLSGSLVVNSNSFTAENKQNSTAQFQATGTGPLLIDGVDYGETDTATE